MWKNFSAFIDKNIFEWILINLHGKYTQKIHKYLLSDSSKNSTFIPKNSANNLIFASVFDSILDLRSSNSTSIFQFWDLASTRLRLQKLWYSPRRRTSSRDPASLIFVRVSISLLEWPTTKKIIFSCIIWFPLVLMKYVFFDCFQVFFINYDHANASTGMHLHNNCHFNEQEMRKLVSRTICLVGLFAPLWRRGLRNL